MRTESMRMRAHDLPRKNVHAHAHAHDRHSPRQGGKMMMPPSIHEARAADSFPSMVHNPISWHATIDTKSFRNSNTHGSFSLPSARVRPKPNVNLGNSQSNLSRVHGIPVPRRFAAYGAEVERGVRSRNGSIDELTGVLRYPAAALMIPGAAGASVPRIGPRPQSLRLSDTPGRDLRDST